MPFCSSPRGLISLLLAGAIAACVSADAWAQSCSATPAVASEPDLGQAQRIEIFGSPLPALSPGERQTEMHGFMPASGHDVWVLTNRNDHIASSLDRMRDGTSNRQRKARDAAAAAKAVAAAVANSDPYDRQANPTTCTGVVVATGEKVLDQTDSSSAGLYGMRLERRYRSIGANGSSDQFFGPNWTSSLDPYRVVESTLPCVNSDVGCIPRDATITFPGGARYRYTIVQADPGTYEVNGSSALGILQYHTVSRTWALAKSKQTYVFNASGIQTAVQDLAGRTLLAYTGLSKVTNIAGKSFTFTWSGSPSRVTQVLDPAGKVWNYTYSDTGVLTTVASPGASPDVRTYHYENAADDTLLTGVSINGVRHSTTTYRSDKRVQTSEFTGGEVGDTFTYLTGSTSVTNSFGQATTFSFASIAGAIKLTDVSTPAYVACGATAATTAYDANGYVDYTLDWLGNKTDSNYDSAGKLTQVTPCETANVSWLR